MDFGMVLQADPPAWRVVDLAVKAETLGFSHAWLFDSHVLWQEPYVIFSQMLSATNRMIVGPMVTNPGTRNWTVTASHYATLNNMFGNRTVCGIGRGDSAMRVLGHTPAKLSTLSESMHVIKELAEGREVTYNGTQQQFPWAEDSKLDVLMAAYGPKALKMCGSETDGFILQLADLSLAEWMIGAVRTAAEEAGRNPDDLYICVAAPAYVGSDLEHQRDQCRWFGGMVGNHVADLVERYGGDSAWFHKNSRTTSRSVRGTTTAVTANLATNTPTSSLTRSSIAFAFWDPKKPISNVFGPSRTSASTSSPSI